MSLLQVVTHPFIGFADVFLFAGVVYGISRFLGLNRLSIKAVVSFFMFLCGTFSVMTWFADLLVTLRPFGWDFGFLYFIHPLAVLAYVVYLMELIHKQAEIDRWKSLALVLPSIMVVLASRTIFIP